MKRAMKNQPMQKRLTLVALFLVLTGIPAAPSALAVGEQFEGYQANAIGSAYTVFPVFPTLIPYDASVEATVGLTQATLSTGGSGFAKASTLWPGVFAGLGPLAKLLCADCPEIPAYPVVVESRDFEEPKQSEEPGLVMKADAKGGERAEAETVTAGQGTEGVFEVGSARTVSSALMETSKLTATSRAVISDITMAAGQIKIGSVETVSTASTDTKTAACSGAAEVNDVTIAGQRAIVDKDGVRSAEEDKPLIPGADPNTVIAATLQAAGVTMRVIDGVEKCDTPTDASRSSGGLLIQMPVPSPGTGIPPGSTLNIILGSTSATTAATAATSVPEAEFVPGDTGAVPPGTPILEEAVARVPGPVSGGGFTDPVDTGAGEAPPAGDGAGDESAGVFGAEAAGSESPYEFGGIPAPLVIGLLLGGVIGVQRICRFMERLFAIGAVR